MRILKAKDGDYRYVTKFLWLPKRFDGVWVWLEVVTIRQLYLYRGVIPGWVDVCLSNPLTGLPANFEYLVGDKLLDIPMTAIGIYSDKD